MMTFAMQRMRTPQQEDVRRRRQEERERWDGLTYRVALSWLMMMYARTSSDNDDATDKLEDCYHVLHFGHWPRHVGSTHYCQECGLFQQSVPGWSRLNA